MVARNRFLEEMTYTGAYCMTGLRSQSADPKMWTGFNFKFHSHKPVMQDVVGYLPEINAPVTQLSTGN